MALKSFEEWKKIHEGKMHVNRERKLSDVEQLQDDGSIKINVDMPKQRQKVGLPASHERCRASRNSNQYNRRQAKRVNLD